VINQKEKDAEAEVFKQLKAVRSELKETRDRSRSRSRNGKEEIEEILP
jgi:hypothetical protein